MVCQNDPPFVVNGKQTVPHVFKDGLKLVLLAVYFCKGIIQLLPEQVEHLRQAPDLVVGSDADLLAEIPLGHLQRLFRNVVDGDGNAPGDEKAKPHGDQKGCQHSLYNDHPGLALRLINTGNICAKTDETFYVSVLLNGKHHVFNRDSRCQHPVLLGYFPCHPPDQDALIQQIQGASVDVIGIAGSDDYKAVINNKHLFPQAFRPGLDISLDLLPVLVEMFVLLKRDYALLDNFRKIAADQLHLICLKLVRYEDADNRHRNEH